MVTWLSSSELSRKKGGGETNLRSKAVAQRTNLCEALLLEVLESLLNNRVDGLLGVGVLAVTALAEPLHDVEAVGAVQRERVAVEDVDNEGVVAVGGEVVGHELGVLPDANDIGDVQQSGAIVLLAGCGLGHVGLIRANLDGLAGGLASVRRLVSTCFAP